MIFPAFFSSITTLIDRHEKTDVKFLSFPYRSDNFFSFLCKEIYYLLGEWSFRFCLIVCDIHFMLRGFFHSKMCGEEVILYFFVCEKSLLCGRTWKFLFGVFLALTAEGAKLQNFSSESSFSYQWNIKFGLFTDSFQREFSKRFLYAMRIVSNFGIIMRIRCCEA